MEQAKLKAEVMKAQEEAQPATNPPSTKVVMQNEGGSKPQIETEETKPQGVVGGDWSSVSPSDAANYMASKTSVPASRWMAIIYRESTNNPYVTNSIGCFGYLQLHPVHGAVSQMSPQQYLDTAAGIANGPQGLSAWEVVTNGSA